jgi:RNA polymerase sigma-70 factor (ECF subfamily)
MATGQGEPAQANGPGSAGSEDERLIQALRERDEAAFAVLVDRYHGQLIRLAMVYVSSRAVAEEVAQETWIGVLQGIGRFEGRSAFRAWLFRILTNQAKRRGERESRIVPFSALAPDEDGGDGPAVSPDRFHPQGHPYAGHWAAYPRDWQHDPERRLLSAETRELARQAIAALPPNQRLVITMRDVEGWSAGEVCNVLAISETNQRVLLHRARSKVRRALERYLEGT